MMKKILFFLIFLPVFTFASGKYYTNSIGQEFVLIKSGSFFMGSKRNLNEQPVLKITISKDFYMQTTEVTQKQWYSVMKTQPWLEVTKKNNENYPVIWISWYEVKEFIKKLNIIEKREKYIYRLPYEAEWEYSCRAGSKTRYFFGENESELKEYAWYNEKGVTNIEISNPLYHMVGQKKANKWGLYDMHGNVFEWCEDWYSVYNKNRKIDPKGSSIGFKKIERGGGWVTRDFRCTSSHRFISDPKDKSVSTGFRLIIAEKTSTQKIKEKIKKTNNKNSGLYPKEITNSIGQKLIYIKPGSFLMGRKKGYDKTIVDEKEHKVTLTNGFYLQDSEVTQGQWFKVMKTRPWRYKKYSVNEGKNYPVVYISWYAAKEYIDKLNKLEKTDKYRLPTEAEWEYACKAGADSDRIKKKKDYGWFNMRGMKEVKLKKPNIWGLYDILGNAKEWCNDWYFYYSKKHAFDPKGAPEAPNGDGPKVIRGTGNSYASRSYGSPYSNDNSIGFRIAKSE